MIKKTAQICFHSRRPHPIIKMNDNINIGGIITGSMNDSIDIGGIITGSMN